jgi:ADP-heptose:LPS heptosyltransferase
MRADDMVPTGQLMVTDTTPVGQNAASSACFGKKRREMIGPYRARNPLLVGALYTADTLASLLPKRKMKIETDYPLRILVANWGHLGDVVAILPLLKFLERHPRVRELGVLIGSWSRPVLESAGISARLHVIDHWALDRSNKSKSRKILRYFARRSSLMRELSQYRYDMSIDTFASIPSSHLITWSVSIPRRVGFTSGGLGPCLTDPFDWVQNDDSMLDHQLELLKPLLGDVYPAHLLASHSGFESASLTRDAGGSRYIVIHMGPSNFRGWVPEKWISLAAALTERGYDLVLTGSAGEEMEAARILSAKIKVRDLTGRLSWQQFVATLAKATAVVTIDSVAGHVAACFSVPTVVLTAGRQRINLWRPNNVNAIVLMHRVGCAPCNRAMGCSAMACIRRIEVQEVLASLRQVMNSKLESSAKSASEPITPSLDNN